MDSRRCQDCNCELNEGEALTFTVCDACWDKHYKTKKQDSQSESATNVSYASPLSQGVQNGGIVLTIEEIYNLAVYAGLVIDEDNSIPESERDSEILIQDNVKVKLDDGTYWTGRGAHYLEYSDDAWIIIKEYKC